MRLKSLKVAASMFVGIAFIVFGIINFTSPENVDNSLVYEQYNGLLGSATDLRPKFSEGEDISAEDLAMIIRNFRIRNIEA